MRTELSRYALFDLRSGKGSSDLEKFSKATGTNKNFLYAAGAADFVMYIAGEDGVYNIMRAFGANPKSKGWKGIGPGIKPAVGVQDGAVYLGLKMNKRF